ncbi:MAG: Hpt domain-containing protein [Cyanobacteria bacterium P01_H01_bin.26]
MAKNFDQEQLAQLSGGDKAFERELLQMFLVDIEDSLGQLTGAIAAGSQADIQDLAHYIKGASANVGAVALSREAAELERLAKKGQLATAPSSLRQLQTLHQEIKRLA